MDDSLSKKGEGQEADKAAMTEDEKRRFDSLAILRQAAWDSFDKRRSYEWKMSFAIWMVISTFIASTLSDNYEPGIFHIFGVAFFGLAIVLIHNFWLIGLRERNRFDSKAGWHYEEIMRLISNSVFCKESSIFGEGLKKLQDEYKKKEKEEKEEKEGKKTWHWSHHTQVGISSILFLAALLSVIATYCEKHSGSWFCP